MRKRAYFIIVVKNPVFDQWALSFDDYSNEAYHLTIDDQAMFNALFSDDCSYFQSINEACRVGIDEYEEEWFSEPRKIRKAIEITDKHIKLHEGRGETKIVDYLIAARELYEEALARGVSINFIF